MLVKPEEIPSVMILGAPWD